MHNHGENYNKMEETDNEEANSWAIEKHTTTQRNTIEQ